MRPHHPVRHRSNAYDQEGADENREWNPSVRRRAVLFDGYVSSPCHFGSAHRDGLIATPKLRADGKLAQERLKAAETRALLEIERERQAAGRLQKELDAATRKAEQGSVRHRDDVQKLQAQVGNLRQQVGVLEGKLDVLRTENARYVDEAVQARDQRDQLALSLTQAAAKQKVSTAKRTAKSTAAPRKSSGPVGKSQRTKKL